MGAGRGDVVRRWDQLLEVDRGELVLDSPTWTCRFYLGQAIRGTPW